MYTYIYIYIYIYIYSSSLNTQLRPLKLIPQTLNRTP